MNKKENKEYFYLLPLAISILIWSLDKSINNFVLFQENIVQYLLELAGLIGLSYLAVNFVLSSKFSFVDNFLGGLDKSYKVHSLIGRLGFTFIFIHPVFGVIKDFDSINTVLVYFFPGNNLSYNLGIAALWLLSLLIILTIVVKIPYNLWKLTHKLMILPFILGAYHGFINTNAEGTIPITTIYIIFLSVIAIYSYIYTEFLLSRSGKVFHYRIERTNTIGSVTEVFLKALGKKLQFNPGQFVSVSFINAKRVGNEYHPYSISSGPSEDILRLSIKDLGDYTSTIKMLKPGTRARIIGPFGEFTLDNYKDRPKVLIAGGIGITPFLSMLRSFKEKKEKNNIYFFYCTKNLDEAIYMKELNDLAQGISNLKVFQHCSDIGGFVTREYLEKSVGKDIKNAVVMICGPLPMMEGIKKQFVDAGKADEDIVFESFNYR